MSKLNYFTTISSYLNLSNEFTTLNPLGIRAKRTSTNEHKLIAGPS